MMVGYNIFMWRHKESINGYIMFLDSKTYRACAFFLLSLAYLHVAGRADSQKYGRVVRLSEPCLQWPEATPEV